MPRRAISSLAALGVGFALGVSMAPLATAATTYPASNGSDGVCNFSAPGTYVFNTDSGFLTPPGGGGGVIGSVEGTLRVLHCTTITINTGSTLAIVGTLAPDLRATGAIQIAGTIDVSANGTTPGPGTAHTAGATSGTAGGGTPGMVGAAGANGAGGGGATAGGGGGGGGLAGGGGGGGNTAGSDVGGMGGGPTGGQGGGDGGGFGRAGSGPGGQSDGTSGSGGGGGGGGGGSYGSTTPFLTGSGGGGGGNGSTPGAAGGGGGGTVRLISPVSITISGGSIDARGNNGFAPSSGTGGGGGGGSGGSAQLIAPTITLNSGATLTAVGSVGGLSAAGGGTGGNGGAGRFDFAVNSLTNIATVNPIPSAQPYSRTLSVSLTGSGAGNVTSSPAGIGCPSDCTEDYDPNAVVTLSAAASPGSTFSGWSGGGCSGTGVCQVTLDASKSVTATFTANPPSPGGGGGDGGGTEPLDTEITKAKVKDDGRAVVKFTGSGGTGALSFECKLDRKRFKPCSSPRRLRNLDEGKHKFKVRAKDSTGAVDATPAKQQLKVSG